MTLVIIGLGLSLLAHADHPEQLRSIEHQLEQKPTAALHIEQSRLYRGLGKLDAALRAIKAAEALDRNFADTILEKAEVYHQAGRHQEALTLLNRYIGKPNARIRSLLLRAQVHLNLHQFNDANQDFKNAASQRATADLYDAWSKAAAKAGRPKLARTILQDGLERIPSAHSLRISLLGMQEGQGHYNEALQTIKPLLQRQNAYRWILHRGKLREKLLQHKRAKEDYETVAFGIQRLLKTHHTAQHLVTYAKALHALGRTEEALIQCRSAIAISPRYEPAQRALDSILASHGNLPD